MDNRHGLITDVSLTLSVGVSEPEAALALVRRQRRKHLRPRSIGADKGFHTQKFVTGLRRRHIALHVACISNRCAEGLDRRSLNSRAYRASQIVRKNLRPISTAC